MVAWARVMAPSYQSSTRGGKDPAKVLMVRQDDISRHLTRLTLALQARLCVSRSSFFLRPRDDFMTPAILSPLPRPANLRRLSSGVFVVLQVRVFSASLSFFISVSLSLSLSLALLVELRTMLSQKRIVFQSGLAAVSRASRGAFHSRSSRGSCCCRFKGVRRGFGLGSRVLGGRI